MHADHVCQSGHQSSESSGRMRYLLILLLCTVVLLWCQEEYVYPSVVTEFIDARTNREGKLTWLITDHGDTLDIQERSGLDGLCADSTYRTITIYEHLEEEASQTYPMVKVYSVQQILSISPVDKNNFSRRNRIQIHSTSKASGDPGISEYDSPALSQRRQAEYLYGSRNRTHPPLRRTSDAESHPPP